MDPKQYAAAESEKEKMIEARLTPAERDILFLFVQNKPMMAAVEKVMLYSIYMMGTINLQDKELYETNWAYAIAHNTNTSNEQLGQSFRAKYEGLTFLDDAFKQLKKFAEKPTPFMEGKNPAV